MSKDASRSEAPRMEELVEHAPYLERLSRALVVDEHAARDLVQETWSRALERPPRDGTNLRAWLAQVLRRTHWRWSERTDPEGLREELVEPCDPARALQRADVQATLAAALDELEGPAREVLELRFFDDVPPRAIAARLALPVSTVNTRLQRALATLRARLDRRLGRGAWVVALAGRPTSPPSTRPGGAEAGARGTERGVRTGARVAAGVLALGATSTLVFLVRADGRPADRAALAHGEGATEATIAPPDTALDRPAGQPERRAVGPTAHDGAAAAPTVPRLAVRVLDPTGRPVAGAEVSSFAATPPPGNLFPVGTADDRGRLELDVEPGLLVPASDSLLGGRVGLMAAAPAWTPSEMHYVVADAGELCLVLGPPGRTVRGRVADADGRAVVGARVEVGEYATLVERDGVLLGTIPRAAHTGADGSFTVEQVPPGTPPLSVSGPGFTTVRARAPEDPEGWVEVVLAHSGRVAGRARDADGEPLEGAELWTDVPGDPRPPARVSSDADGAFVLDVPAGEHHVFARDPRRPERVATRRVTVRRGEEVAWNPRLLSSRGLTVELVDGAGEPLVDWRVNLASEDLLWLDGVPTDARGRLTVVALPEGRLSVSVLGPRLELGRVVVPRLSVGGITPADSPLRLVVSDATAPSARIAGELVGPLGLPPPNTRITLRREVEAAEANLTLNATGRFSTPRIPPDTWLLRADIAGFGSFDLGTVSLEAGEELELGRVALPAPGGLALTWSARPGDRVSVGHRVHGRTHPTHALAAPPERRLVLVPGEVRIELHRDGRTYERSASVAPGIGLAVDLDSLLAD